MSGMSNMRPVGRMSCVALKTTQMWAIRPSGDPRFDMPAVNYTGYVNIRGTPVKKLKTTSLSSFSETQENLAVLHFTMHNSK
jgi:hypothetical protein